MAGSKPGERRGGRKRGVPNKATAEIKGAAQQYGMASLKRLVWLMENATSEQTQAYCADKLLDRGYGKPGQHVEHSGTISLANLIADSLGIAAPVKEGEAHDEHHTVQ